MVSADSVDAATCREDGEDATVGLGDPGTVDCAVARKSGRVSWDSPGVRQDGGVTGRAEVEATTVGAGLGVRGGLGY